MQNYDSFYCNSLSISHKDEIHKLFRIDEVLKDKMRKEKYKKLSLVAKFMFSASGKQFLAFHFW